MLFFAEMWERFSYYGMRAIYVLYLTQHFLFEDKFASGQYGAYTSLVYLMPLVGGFLADRYLGTRKSVAFGAILLVIGQLGMAIHAGPSKQYIAYAPAGATAAAVHYDVQPWRWARRQDDAPDGGRQGLRDELGQVGRPRDQQSARDGEHPRRRLPAGSFKKVTVQDPMFVTIMYLALGFIIMGVGFLKANISAIVGQLYPQGDPRRDPGFTLYYYGVNLGAFWSAILCGWLGATYGWGWGFGLAGVGMLLGFIVFVLGKPLLQGKEAEAAQSRKS